MYAWENHSALGIFKQVNISHLVKAHKKHMINRTFHSSTGKTVSNKQIHFIGQKHKHL